MSSEYIRVVRDRLETVQWNDSNFCTPLLTTQPSPNPLSKADLRNVVKMTMNTPEKDYVRIIDKGSAVSGPVLVDQLGDASRWYLQTTIRDVQRITERLTLLRKVKNATEPRFRGTLVKWGFSDQPEDLPRGRPRLFIREFGLKDASWRDRVSVGTISTTNNCHFATVAVFGPQRLAIIYDSAGGAYDHEEIKKVRPHSY